MVSVNAVTYYQVVCDCCGVAADYGDYTAWSDTEAATEMLDGTGFEAVGDEHLCNECWKWPDEDAPSDDAVRRHTIHPDGSAT